jgi:hypothetical protein
MNPDQQRSLQIGLALIEEGLLEIEGWLTGEPRQGRLSRTIPDLSPRLRRDIREGGRAATGLVAGLADEFDLEPHTRSLADMTFGRLPILWQMARECGARHLVAYGPVPPDLPGTLDPLVDALSELLWHLFSVVAAERRPTAPG